jgi:NADP-dependent 3-hydroxy acid dehydrogenase YdfG
MTVISSIAGLIGFPLRSGYSASKHAIKGILETLQWNCINQYYCFYRISRKNSTNISKNAFWVMVSNLI